MGLTLLLVLSFFPKWVLVREPSPLPARSGPVKKFTWGSSLDTLNKGPRLLSLLLCDFRGTSEPLTGKKPLGEERVETNLV